MFLYLYPENSEAKIDFSWNYVPTSCCCIICHHSHVQPMTQTELSLANILFSEGRSKNSDIRETIHAV